MRREGDAAMPNTLYRRAPLGVLARLRSGDNTSGDSFSKDDSLPTPVYGANGVIGSTSLEPNIQRESILVGRVGSCGEINVAPPSSFASDNVLVVDLNEQAHRGWMYYLLLSLKLKDLNTSTAQPLITASKIRQLRVPFPSMMDQLRIADYLDVETGQIDTTVSTLDELIEEMKSRRVQLIQESVSNSDSYVGSGEFAEINPSSHEGMVDDVKWDMVPLGLVAEFHTGWTPPSGDDRYYGGSHKWANISDVGTRHLYDTERTISDFALEKHPGARLALPGDLLFPFKLSIGAVSFACEEMYTNEAIAVFPPNEKIDLRFAYYVFPYFLLKNAGVNIYGAPLLNSSLIKQARIPLPPLEAQQRITDYLDVETAKIDKIVSTATELRSELLARRSALITEVVTGQRQV